MDMTILTGRQREIAELVAQGLNNAQIAWEACIEPGTVRNHLTAIYRAFNLDGHDKRRKLGELVRLQRPGGTTHER